jgi:hypothetical protein
MVPPRQASLVMHRREAAARNKPGPLTRLSRPSSQNKCCPVSLAAAGFCESVPSGRVVVRSRDGMALSSPPPHLLHTILVLLKELDVRHAHSRTALALTAGLLAVLGTSGCRATGRGTSSTERSESFLRVDNRSMLDMTVYVLRGGERRRLGLVNALSTQMLSIPRVLIEGAGVLRFLADPIGGTRTPVSEEIVVRHGDVVQLIIPPQ